jgi:hypothetical protein
MKGEDVLERGGGELGSAHLAKIHTENLISFIFYLS